MQTTSAPTLSSRLGLWTLALALGCTMAGCRHRARPQEDTLVTAYKLIDAHRDDEAILLLENKAEQTPVDSPYRRKLIALEASVYAHKAGIRVQSFIPSMKTIKDNKIDFTASAAAFAKVDQAKSRTEAVDRFGAAISVFLRNFIAFSAIYGAIPRVEEKNEKFLKFALDLLNSLGTKDISQNDAMYRAVIRIIYIKNFLAEDFGKIQESDAPIQNCQVDLDKIAEKFTTLRDLGVATYQDLALATPSKAKGFQTSSNNFAEVMTRLTQVNSVASIVDNATMMFIKQALIQNELRDLLKCSASVPASSASSSALSSSDLPAPVAN